MSVFILVNNASCQLSFHLRFTAINTKFWDFSSLLLDNVLLIFLSVVIGARVSMRGISCLVSDSGPLNVITDANKHLCNTRARRCPLS